MERSPERCRRVFHLEAGLLQIDEFQARGLKLVGASRQAARLESSKSFAKDFMARHGIPTARYSVARSADEAVAVLESGEFGPESAAVVVKADGLAAGKGVVVAKDRSEGLSAISSLTNGEVIDAEAARTIVIEECLTGREVSVLLLKEL